MTTIRLPYDLAPADAVDYFTAKGLRPTFDWRDMWQAQHALDFTVAKLTDVDLLADVQASLTRALTEGQSYRQWADGIAPELRRRGWWGRQLRRDPVTGEDRSVQLGSARRLRIIHDANMRTAMAAGQWRRIEAIADRRPYLRYVSVQDARVRPEHAAWHGTILPWDHPWWRTHFPPNGWRCRCRVVQLSERDLDRRGWTVSDDPVVTTRDWTNRRTGSIEQVPTGIDPGWAYHVGQADRGAVLARQLLDRSVTLSPDIASRLVAPFLDRLLPAIEADFAAWLDDLDPARPLGTVRVVGLIGPAVLDWLSARGLAPHSAAVTVTDRMVADMRRGAEGTERLDLADITHLPAILARPRAVLWDQQPAADSGRPGLVFVFDPDDGDASSKIVVRVDVDEPASSAGDQRRGPLANAIRAGGTMDSRALRQDRYTVIAGQI